MTYAAVAVMGWMLMLKVGTPVDPGPDGLRAAEPAASASATTSVRDLVGQVPFEGRTAVSDARALVGLVPFEGRPDQGPSPRTAVLVRTLLGRVPFEGAPMRLALGEPAGR